MACACLQHNPPFRPPAPRRPSPAPFRVLAAHSGSPQYDAEILRLLLVARPNTEYVVVHATKNYEKLKADERLGKHVTLVETPLLETVPHEQVTVPGTSGTKAGSTAGASKASGDALSPASFDLVHCALWRKPFGTASIEGMDVLMHLTKAGGSLVTFTFAPAGVFNLRDRLAVRLGQTAGDTPAEGGTDLVGERPELRLSMWLHQRVGSAWPAPATLGASGEGGTDPPAGVALADEKLGSSSSQTLHEAGRSDVVWAWRERLASHINVTALMSEQLNVTTQRALEDLVEAKLSTMQEADPEILEDVLMDLVDMSLDGDGHRGSIVVYTPLDATLIRRPASVADVGALVPAGTPHAAQYTAALTQGLPLLPLDVFALANAVAPNAVECALGLADYLKANPDVVADPHSSLKLCPLRGPWGSFTGTGASTDGGLKSTALTLAVHDAAVQAAAARRATSAGVAGKAAHTDDGASGYEADSEEVGGGITGDEVSRALLRRDPWWPQGERGGFFNVGLQNWYDMRETWTARTTNMQKPPPPPKVDFDQVYDELAVLRRSYTLPGPMRLTDVVDLFVEMWAAEEMNMAQAAHPSAAYGRAMPRMG